jgi:transcription initiation factor IIF auxiliary subunit
VILRLSFLYVILVCTPVLWAQVKVNNSSTYIGNGRWQWTIFIEARPELLDKISCVEYRLHPSFPDPLQQVCERGSKEAFALNGSGWGEFNVKVRVSFTDRREEVFDYWLKLVSPTEAKICSVAQSRLLEEEEVWALQVPWEGVYFYVDEIHKSKPSEIVVFSSKRPIDSQSFSWAKVRDQLKRSTSAILAEGTRKDMRVSNEKLASVRLPGGKILNFFPSALVGRSSMQLNVCNK